MRERENLDDLPPLGEPDDDGRWPPPPGEDAHRKAGSANADREIALHWHRDADPDAERAWLVRNTIGEVGKGLLAGQWGTYKTFIVLDLSGAVMLGGSFAGRKVTRQGGVLFIAPEGAFEVPIRLRGLVEGKLRGATIAGAITGAAIPDLADLPFAWIEECPRLVTDGAADALIRVAERASAEMQARYGVPLALVVVDTVAAGAGFDDENSAAETQKVMNVLEQLAQRVKAFVLGVDHFGKSVETGTRGSSAKEAAAATVLAALGTKDEAGNVSNTRLAVRKVRGARTGQEIPYGVEVITIGEDRWGDPITTCIVNWQTERQDEAPAAGAGSKWPVALKVFRAALTNTLAGQDTGKRIRPFGSEGPEVFAATDKAVRSEFCAAYPADGETNEQRNDAKGKAFKRARAQALGKGLIAAREVGGVDYLWLASDDPTGQ